MDKLVLNILTGQEQYKPILELNEETIRKFGLKEGDIVEIKDFSGVYPLIVRRRKDCAPGYGILSPSLMFRLGIMEDDQVELVKIDNFYEIKLATIRIFGKYSDWLEKRKNLIGLPLELDENLLLTKDTSISILDLEPYKNDGVGHLTEESLVFPRYSGLYNLVIVIDQSEHMLEEWKGKLKVRVLRHFFKKRLPLKIRRAAKLSVLTLADEPQIYINWMRLKIDLRMILQNIIEKIVENIEPKREYEDVNYANLLKYLEGHLSSGDPDYISLIILVSAKEYDYDEKEEALKLLERLKEKFGNYIKIVGIPIGATYSGRFVTLRALTEATGGIFFNLRTPEALLNKIKAVPTIVDLPVEKVGDWK